MLGNEALRLRRAPGSENAAGGGKASPRPFRGDERAGQIRNDYGICEEPDGGQYDDIGDRRRDQHVHGQAVDRREDRHQQEAAPDPERGGDDPDQEARQRQRRPGQAPLLAPVADDDVPGVPGNGHDPLARRNARWRQTLRTPAFGFAVEAGFEPGAALAGTEPAQRRPAEMSARDDQRETDSEGKGPRVEQDCDPDERPDQPSRHAAEAYPQRKVAVELTAAAKPEQGAERVEKGQELRRRRHARRGELQDRHGVGQREDARGLAHHRHGVTGPETHPDQVPYRHFHAGERKRDIAAREESVLQLRRAEPEREDQRKQGHLLGQELPQERLFRHGYCGPIR